MCVSKLCVDKCLCVEEAAGRRRRRARGSAQPKTRTPHKVGEKVHTINTRFRGRGDGNV